MPDAPRASLDDQADGCRRVAQLEIEEDIGFDFPFVLDRVDPFRPKDDCLEIGDSEVRQGRAERAPHDAPQHVIFEIGKPSKHGSRQQVLRNTESLSAMSCSAT